MKIAYNPTSAGPLKSAPTGDYLNAITFDLAGHNIFARGEMFKGTDTTYEVFKKYTSDDAGGYNGLVPAPSYNGGSNVRFLREDGSWQAITSNSYRPLLINNTTILDSQNNKGFNLVSNSSIILNPKKDSNSNYTGEVVIDALNATQSQSGFMSAADKTKLDNMTFTPGDGFSGTLADAFTIITALGKSITASAGKQTVTFIPSTGIDINIDTNNYSINISGVAMVGASSENDGSSGLVPKPTKTDYGKFLRGDGTWQAVSAEDTKVTQTDTTTNATYRLLFSGTADNTTRTEGARKSEKLTFNPNSGVLSATSFVGNIDGTYVNNLTGYAKATTMGAIAATDSLNTALGKLEFKTDFIYNDLFGTDSDDIINKWSEIVSFVDSIKEGTDITDEFVTRKTAQTITGEKTFSGTTSTLLTIDRDNDSPSWICFKHKGSLVGYLGVTSDKKPQFNNGSSTYDILHSGNSHIRSGVITINGTSITPITSHQSLANYVTLDGTETISGVKTFSTLLKFTVAEGTAPFTVTSKTLVTNLNAGLLGGYTADSLFEGLENDTNQLSVTIGGTNKKLTVQYALTVGNLSGGAVGTVVYQKKGGETAYLEAPEINNMVLKYDTSKGCPYWASDNNSDYRVTNTLNTEAKAFITGTESSTTNTGTQIFDTGVYLGVAPGTLFATTFVGNLEGTANAANKIGTTDLGNLYQPIYLVEGAPTLAASYGNAITEITKSGNTFTYTRIDGTTGTFAQTDNDSWRAILVNGTQLAGTGTGTYALNFAAGDGITLGSTAGSSTAANKILITNSGVRSVTLDGNLLKVNTGGTETKLTIPYATLVANNLVLKIKSGTTEGTDLYTYNGSNGKTLDIKAGSNITLTAAAGSLTISSTNTNTTYTLSGALSGNTFVNTLTPSSGNVTTSTVPAMAGATSSAAGTAGLVPAPASGKLTSFLRGDGTWVIPTNTKNTAGATNSTSKLFLIGALELAANPQTYSNSGVYMLSGNMFATHYYETSDQKFKTNIKSILDSDNIPTLRAFDWKDSGKHSYGFIAQELEAQGYGELVDTDEEGSKTVNYSAALSLTVAKLLAKINELEKQIKELRNG